MMQKSKLTVIHAADLHLGAPFKGIGASSGGGFFPSELKDTLVQATYDALDRLVRLCLEIRPHALLLAGDLYNPECGGLKSLNALKQACQRLEQGGVPVLMVHGNHDAANLQPSWTWPDNVHIFRADQAESVPLLSKKGLISLGAPIGEGQAPGPDADCLAIIHGISHAQEKVSENLSLAVSRHVKKIAASLPGSAWKIGLLHCAVGEKASEGEKPYAPCSMEDLAQTPVDYWALGHIHKRGMVTQNPLAWYSGNSQGMHINETGPKGCLIVNFAPGLNPEISFRSLANVEWHQLDYTASQNASLSALQEDLLNLSVKRAVERAEAKLKGLVIRLRIKGRTGLDGWLREKGNELQAQIQSALNSAPNDALPFVWIKDIIIETSPALDLEKALASPGLVGETLNRIAAAQASVVHSGGASDELLGGNESPLGKLYNSAALRQAGIQPPEPAALAELLAEAGWLCADLLKAEDAAPAQEQLGAETGNGE